MISELSKLNFVRADHREFDNEDFSPKGKTELLAASFVLYSAESVFDESLRLEQGFDNLIENLTKL